MSATYDFLVSEPNTPVEDDKPKTPDYVGPNTKTTKKMDRKKFGQAIFNVLERMGGEDWLFREAKADPKNFMELLKKMVPKQTIADEVSDLYVKLINRYGDSIEIESHAIKGNAIIPPSDSDSATGRQRSGQPQIATGGNLPQITERYDA